MSRWIILQREIERQTILKLPSLFTGEETARDMYVSKSVWEGLHAASSDEIRGLRVSEFRQTLDAFSEGGQISVSEDPDKKPWDTMLARVHPIDAEFFCIRVTAPEDTPGIRCLGAFIEKNTFLALNWDLREDIGENFDEAVQSVRDDWRKIFSDVTPFKGDNIDEYLEPFFFV